MKTASFFLHGSTRFFFSNSKKIVLPLLALLFMTACVHRAPLPVKPLKPAVIWQNMLLKGPTHSPAFEISFNLVSAVANSPQYRLKGQLWGNTKGPVRLDLRAGFGMLVGMVAEENDRWLFYNALRQMAFQGTMRTLSREMTIALPFSLQTLAAVMLGSVKEILPPQYQSATVAPDGTIVYHFSRETGAKTLKVSPAGLPMELETDTWQMSWPNWETGNVPPRLHFKNTRASILLFLKKHAFYDNEYPASQIQLQLPPDVQVVLH